MFPTYEQHRTVVPVMSNHRRERLSAVYGHVINLPDTCRR